MIRSIAFSVMDRLRKPIDGLLEKWPCNNHGTLNVPTRSTISPAHDRERRERRKAPNASVLQRIAGCFLRDSN